MSEINLKWSGGKKLEKVLQNLESKASKGGVLRAGFLEGAKYPDGTSVAQVAAYNEFGTRKTPPRPFFRLAIAKNSKQWGKKLGRIISSNGYDAKGGLMIMGEVIKGQIVESIVDLASPPLKPSTVRRKGFSKPLIETAHMKNSVDYEVKQ